MTEAIEQAARRLRFLSTPLSWGLCDWPWPMVPWEGRMVRLGKAGLHQPLNAPFRSSPGATWGAWDILQPYAWNMGANHVTGCGPVSVLRMVGIYRKQGMEGVPWNITLRLPKDDLTYSGVPVTVSGSAMTYRYRLVEF